MRGGLPRKKTPVWKQVKLVKPGNIGAAGEVTGNAVFVIGSFVVVCLDLETGFELWRRPISDVPDHSIFCQRLWLFGTEVISLEAEGTTEIRNHGITATASRPLQIGTDIVVGHTRTGQIVAIDCETGTHRVAALGPKEYAMWFFLYRNSTLYAFCRDKIVRHYSWPGGALKDEWHLEVADPKRGGICSATWADDGDMLIFHNHNNSVVRLDPATREWRWERVVRAVLGETGARLVAREKRIAVAGQYLLTMLNADTGGILWEFDFYEYYQRTANNTSHPVFAGDYIYCTPGNHVVALEVATGKLAWESQKVTGDIMRQPIITEDRIIVVTLAGNVYCFQ